MKTLMRYKIISGRVVEKRDVLVDVSLNPAQTKTGEKRGSYRGKSGAAQIERNCREAVKRLGRILNCNFGLGDLFLSLKYSDARLPATREDADRELTRMVRRLERRYHKATGKKMKWVGVTADTSSKTGLPVRLHHHMVVPVMELALIYQVWPSDQVTIRHLDGRGDYTGIARYMLQNSGYRRKRRTWRSSNGLDKPIFTKPEPIRGGAGSFHVPKQALVMERHIRQDGESGFSSAYIRYVVPDDTKNTRKRYAPSPEPGFSDTTRRARPRGSSMGNGG